MVNTDQIPDALKAIPQWVCWTTDRRDGQPTKVPIDPATGAYASVTEPDTWAAYADAVDHYRHSDVDGLGFVFQQDDPYAGVAFSLFDPGQQTMLHDHILFPEGRVHFAGEHTSLMHAWIQGALDSGLRAAWEIHHS
jgi:monoamine oxidase